MATAKAEGKSGFLKEFLVDHPDAAKDAIDAAWREAGHEGTISTSLISKVRREEGGKGVAKGKSRPRGAPAKASGGPVTASSARPASPVGPGGDRISVLIRLEGALDELLHEIKLTGGLPEFEETLRRARRILVRSYGE